MDIHAFLAARYDEDDARARHAFADHNEAGPHWTEVTTGVIDTFGPDLDSLIVIGDGPMARHIAEWDPARVLAETAAKRRMLAYLVELENKALDGNWWNLDRDLPLKLLALPYAHHPGYQKDWAPSD
jgi:hypothetical protein